ncbi:MAG TPA: cyclic nucleotide-binding domain-containing protein [Spirochaetota bacterium]|nr:cyclic nucleotide-binding domain-containing protein [Spirochaetota bacterium]HQQ51573.1 cyclic nucleotide-binding domain-containing protein [Spirochaetota bacterium]
MKLYKSYIDETILIKLQDLSLFKGLSQNVIRNIALVCTVKKIKRGKCIIKEGDMGDELYIILNGEIEIQKRTLQDEPYTVVTMNANETPLYVGELAMIDNDKRSATVIAKQDCDCLVLKRKDFIKFGDRNPKEGLILTRAIALKLAQSLRRTNDDVITLFSALVDEISGETELGKS